MNWKLALTLVIVVIVAVVVFAWSPWDNSEPAVEINDTAVCAPIEGKNLKVEHQTNPLAYIVVDGGLQVKLWPFAYEQAGSIVFFQADFQFLPGKMVEYGYPLQWQALIAQSGAIPIDATTYPYAVATCDGYVVIWRTGQIPVEPAIMPLQPAGIMPPLEQPSETPPLP